MPEGIDDRTCSPTGRTPVIAGLEIEQVAMASTNERGCVCSEQRCWQLRSDVQVVALDRELVQCAIRIDWMKIQG